jgi:hypothetical protein
LRVFWFLQHRRSVSYSHRMEFSLWGDFICDLVSGSVRDAAFTSVEFEDAAENSLFRPQAGRRNSHWGTRADHGVSQVIDWLFRISREDGSDQLQRDFGARHLRLMGLVVVGRSADVKEYDRVRLESPEFGIASFMLWFSFGFETLQFHIPSCSRTYRWVLSENAPASAARRLRDWVFTSGVLEGSTMSKQ